MKEAISHVAGREHAGTKPHFAFITDEFMTEELVGGGLATYIDRMSRTLLELGVEMEIFVRSTSRDAKPHDEL